MKNLVGRREALRHLAVFSGAAVAAQLVSACKSKPSCNDVSGLSPEDARARSDTAGYVEQSMDAAKNCSNCVHYVPAAPNACGSCKVVKGPIGPAGSCKLWTARPT